MAAAVGYNFSTNKLRTATNDGSVRLRIYFLFYPYIEISIDMAENAGIESTANAGAAIPEVNKERPASKPARVSSKIRAGVYKDCQPWGQLKETH